MAQLSAIRGPMPADAVKINANENPLGPCEEALAAIHKIAKDGGRYLYEETFGFQELLAEQEGVKPNYVQPYAGSSAPLHQAVLGLTSPTKPFVTADPGYEAPERAAQFIGTKVIRVPLTKTYAHDVKAMVKAHPSPGAYYIVNPNNPTGTMTPREDILWLLANKPAGSIVIVDEAYHHFSDHESVIDQVALDKDIIVMRTFSKIYGMAGLRAGFAVARPDLLQRLGTVPGPSRSLASISITSSAAARASLQDKDLVPLRRKINTDVRSETLEFLEKHGYKTVAGSQANMFMVDVKRPGKEFQQAMLKENVAIGRTWAAMPNYVRVTVGTKQEMAKFESAFVKCMDMPPGAVNGASLHMPEFHVPSELYRA